MGVKMKKLERIFLYTVLAILVFYVFLVDGNVESQVAIQEGKTNMTNIDFLHAIETINNFYNHSFTNLLYLVGAIGIVWPILLNFLFNLRYKSRENIIEKKLNEKIDDVIKDKENEFNTKLQNYIKELDEKNNKLFLDIVRGVNDVKSGLLHTIGNILLDKKDVKGAFIYFYDSFNLYFTSRNTKGMQTTSHLITDKIIPLIKKDDFYIYVEEKSKKIIEKLKSINKNEIYDSLISKFQNIIINKEIILKNNKTQQLKK
jgi:hypothetical protein